MRRKAHHEALVRSVPEAERAFALADPVAAFERGLGLLAPAPHAPIGLAPARKARRAAFKEIEQIDVDVLDAAPAVQLRAIAFGLERIEEAASGRSATRTDPTVGIVEAHRVLDVVDRERASGRAEGLPDVLPKLGAALRADLDDLGAASAETLGAALSDLRQLQARVEALAERDPSLSAAARSLAAELGTLHERTSRQHAALPPQSDLEWSHWPPPARGQPSLRRLPPVLGKQPLMRRLEVEEGLDRPFVEAVPQLLRLAARLDDVTAKLVASAPRDEGASAAPADVPRPVDATRCEPIVARLRAVTEGGEAPRELACEWLLVQWGARSLSDAALTLAVIDDGLVGPDARRQRAAAPSWIALLSGTTAPRSHVLAKGLAVAVRLGDRETIELAVSRTRDALCSAVTASWIHGELGDRDRLEQWLQRDCPSREPAAWIAEILARPRAAMDGLALTLVGPSPVGATMLDLVPWAPLGLVPPIAKPRRQAATPTSGDATEVLPQLLRALGPRNGDVVGPIE
jgi:hypothetical protein